MDYVPVLFLGFVGAALAFWSLPRMVIEGVLSGTEAVLLAFGLAVLLVAAGALVAVAPQVSTVLTAVFPFALSVIPYLRHRLRDRGLRSLEDADIERCRRTIAFDARNTGAHLQLAETLRTQGQYSEAVRSYETVLTLDKDSRQARRGIEECLNLLRAQAGQSWLCHICHVENEPQAAQCSACRTPRARPARADMPSLQRVAIWVGVGLEAAVIGLYLVGALGECGVVLASLFVAGVTYAVYGADPRES